MLFSERDVDVLRLLNWCQFAPKEAVLSIMPQSEIDALISVGFIKLNTLLPHCRYQTPGWLTDTIRRLLDDYEAAGNTLPCFERALLVIDEHSDVSGRHIFDSDNKGWKAVSNAIKGRLIPDDDQYTLSVALLSKRSGEDVCHISLLDLREASDFFAGHSGYYAASDIYEGRWP